MVHFPQDLLKAIILEWNILHFYNLALLEIFKLFATFFMLTGWRQGKRT